VDVGGEKKKRNCNAVCDLNKKYKEHAGQLSYPGYIQEIRNFCACILGYPEMNC